MHSEGAINSPVPLADPIYGEVLLDVRVDNDITNQEKGHNKYILTRNYNVKCC
jgi:hypothetical protein